MRPLMQAVSNDNFGPLIAYLVPGGHRSLGIQFVLAFAGSMVRGDAGECSDDQWVSVSDDCVSGGWDDDHGDPVGRRRSVACHHGAETAQVGFLTACHQR